MIIYVQSDIGFEEVDTSVLRPQKGKPSDGQDRERIAEWLFKRERRKNNSVVAAVGRDEVRHVRSHFGVNKAVEQFVRMSKEGESMRIALNTEGINNKKNPSVAMLQMSASVKGREYAVVFQLRSEKPRNPDAPSQVF